MYSGLMTPSMERPRLIQGQGPGPGSGSRPGPGQGQRQGPPAPRLRYPTRYSR